MEDNSVEQDFKELNISLDHICLQTTKDAGHSWIEFSDKFKAFERKVLALLNSDKNDAVSDTTGLNQGDGLCSQNNHIKDDGNIK